MATLTRTRPTFQVEDASDADVEPRRPLHLDIPTPFPQVTLSAEQHREEARTRPDGASTVQAADGTREPEESMDTTAVADALRKDENTEDTASSVSTTLHFNLSCNRLRAFRGDRSPGSSGYGCGAAGTRLQYRTVAIPPARIFSIFRENEKTSHKGDCGDGSPSG